MANQNPSRRAVVAALAGTPMFAGTIGFALASSAEAATVVRSAWNRALAAYERAQGAHDDYQRTVWRPAYQRALAEVGPMPEDGMMSEVDPTYHQRWTAAYNRHVPRHVDDRIEELGSASNRAEGVLLKLPAPDRQGLLWKLERTLDEGDGGWSDEIRELMLSDARRLLSGEG